MLMGHLPHLDACLTGRADAVPPVLVRSRSINTGRNPRGTTGQAEARPFIAAEVNSDHDTAARS